MSFGQRLAQAVKAKKNGVCVGIDPRWQQLPESIRKSPEKDGLQAVAQAYKEFSCAIIDTVASLVPIIKPQSAFFEELGAAGVVVLEQITKYATEAGLLVVMDGKRNDIGSTATAYAKAYLGRKSPFGSDALTVSPYLGTDSLNPFVDECIASDAGIFVLVKTSNPGSGFIQDLSVDSSTISERVADYVQQSALKTLQAQGTSADRAEDCKYGDIGCVVGATYPEQLTAMRERMPNAWILIPGFGAQGGSAKDVKLGFDSQGLGAIVNSSRGIIFAHENPKFAHAGDWTRSVEMATKEMIEQLS